MKRIIDVCCGSKMFWFNKDNPDVEFCDIREMPKTEYYPGRYIEISPDRAGIIRTWKVGIAYFGFFSEDTMKPILILKKAISLKS